MGRKSKTKGKVGEREAAHELSRLFACQARRGVQYQGGPESPDIVSDIPVHFEVKRTEKLQLWPAIEQAEQDAHGKIPVVLHRPNLRPWLVILNLEDLPGLVEKLHPFILPQGETCPKNTTTT